ncbi:MAG: hypothetical protein OSA98_24450 [Rubripirellula sp.]|nr:hypothetical protein [Rubripirellula sp.]
MVNGEKDVGDQVGGLRHQRSSHAAANQLSSVAATHGSGIRLPI